MQYLKQNTKIEDEPVVDDGPLTQDEIDQLRQGACLSAIIRNCNITAGICTAVHFMQDLVKHPTSTCTCIILISKCKYLFPDLIQGVEKKDKDMLKHRTKVVEVKNLVGLLKEV